MVFSVLLRGFVALLALLVVVIVVRRLVLSNSLYKLYFSEKSDKNFRTQIQDLLQNVRYNPSNYSYVDYHGYFQTMLQFSVRTLFRKLTKYVYKKYQIIYKREEVTCYDGGTVSLDWAHKYDDDIVNNLPDDAPIVVLSHGMAGSSNSEYIVHLAWKFISKKYRVASYVARGCGGLKITAGSIFAGRKTKDILFSINKIRQRYPAAKIFYIGFSLGAALELQYLADYHKDSGITAAIAVTPPWNMSSNINTPSASAFFSFILSIPIKLFLIKHYYYLKKISPESKDLSKKDIFWAKDVYTLDKQCTAIYGDSYGSMDNYYKYTDVNPIEHVHLIQTPTICLTAIDDPICNHKDAVTDPNKIAPNLVVIKTVLGGHVAYPEGTLQVRDSWVDRLALTWFDQFLNK